MAVKFFPPPPLYYFLSKFKKWRTVSEFKCILIQNMEGGGDISTSPSFFPWLLRVSMLIVKRDLGFFVHHKNYIQKTFEIICHTRPDNWEYGSNIRLSLKKIRSMCWYKHEPVQSALPHYMYARGLSGEWDGGFFYCSSIFCMKVLPDINSH